MPAPARFPLNRLVSLIRRAWSALRPARRAGLRVRPSVEALEPRVLYSADPLALASLSAEVRMLDSQDTPAIQPPDGPVGNAAARATLAAGAASGATASDAPERTAPVHELIFVDAAVADAQVLIDGILASRAPDAHVEVVQLRADRDGLAQISERLAQARDLAAVHIVSHGDQGLLQLGSGRVDAGTLQARAAELAAWQTALGAQADLLLWGCNVGEGEVGSRFIGQLAAFTGADVAASTDPTGSAAAGGDWLLELHTGAIEARFDLLASALPQRWEGVLALTPQGGETRVNTTTTQVQQTRPGGRSVAMDGAGNYVVTWYGRGSVDFTGVYFQRYDASGVAQGGETLVNTTTTGPQEWPLVAMDPNGNFVIVFEDANGLDGSGYGIYGQRYNASGAAQGGQFRINTTTTGDQAAAGVAMDASGNFAVAWMSTQTGDFDVYVQRYNAAGVAQGGEVRVNTTTTGIQDYPTLAMDATGGFVVAWTSDQGAFTDIYARRYDSSGTALGGEFQVNTDTVSAHSYASAAMASDGSFVMAWASAAQDPDSTEGIYAQRYNASGVAQGAEFRVNTYTTLAQSYPVVAMNATGGFIVTWQSTGQDGSLEGVYAQQFLASGSPTGTELRINTTTANEQRNASVAYAGSQSVVVWSGDGVGDGTAVFAQRLSVSVPPGITVGTVSGNTSETGTTASFTVVLDTVPSSNVTIPVSVSNALEAGASTALLTFTSANWSTPQTVTLTGLDDTLDDGDRSYTAVLGAASSADGAYNGLDASDVALQNLDNDTRSTVTVTTTADTLDGDTGSLYALLGNRGADGEISLREALTAANATANGSGGADRIHFAISGTGVHTLNIGSALPVITDPVILDASTDDSFAANSNRPAVILDGNNAFAGDGLVLAGTADGSTIRGVVVRDFSGDGIEIQVGANGNTVAGNYIGSLSALGANVAGEGNTDNGLRVLGASNTIGGLTAADRNVIAGNQQGIQISGLGIGNLIIGNYIGTDATGLVALGNTDDGIGFDAGSSGNTVGGTTAAERNVIAANGDDGFSTDTSNHVVQGNYIGVGADGVTALGNGGDGVELRDNAAGNRIGGTLSGQGNLIRHNSGDGIFVSLIGSPPTGNFLLGNSIDANTGLGIDLGTDGVTANDAGDADTGANNLQNFPVLASAVTNGATQLAVSGTLNAVANSPFRIEFFASTNADPSGYGEGQIYLGYVHVTTDGSGNATFDTTVSAYVAAGVAVSATATRSDVGYTSFTDTSEFAANVAATLGSINSVPAFSGLDGAPTYVAGGSAVILDNTVTVSDAQLSGANNFSGATLTLARQGGASAQDALAFDGIVVTTSGADVLVNGVQVGSYGFTAGQLDITFNGSATGARVNALLQNIVYWNTSGSPPASVPIAWTFSDGNAGAQGAGGAMLATGSTTVTISGVNAAPVLTAPASVGMVQNTTFSFSPDLGRGISFTDSDIGSGQAQLTLGVAQGTLTLAQTTGLSFTTGDGTADATLVFTGTAAAIHAALDGLVYAPTTNYVGSDSLTITVSDQGNTGTGGARSDSGTVPISIGAHSFLQGQYVEMGVQQTGNFGADGAVPPGFLNPASTYPTGSFGIYADYGRDGWYVGSPGHTGDYVYPTEEWGIHVGGTTFRNRAGLAPAIAGSLSATVDTGPTQQVEWTGGTAGIAVKQLITLTESQLHFSMTVTLTNVSGGTLNDVYFYRSFDPNQEYSWTSDYATLNWVDSQGGDPSGTAVIATAGASYPSVALRMSSTGSDARVAQGGWSNINPVDAYLGINAFAGTGLYTEASPNYADEAITLLRKVSTLAPGATATFVIQYDMSSNTAPQVDLDANDSTAAGSDAAVSYTPGGPAVTVADVDATVISIDSPTLSSMTLTLAGALDGPAETLAATTAGTSITASWSGGVLTLSGSDTVAHYQQVLRTVTYDNASGTPTAGERRVDVVASDGVNLSTAASSHVTIAGSGNVAPVIAAVEGSPLAHTENAAATPVTATLTLSDADSANLGGATVSISANFASGQDVLAFTNQNGITGGWNAGTGVLTLSGSATVAQYQAALRSITYANSSDAPSTATRTVSFVVNDGISDSAAATRQITVAAVNDAPVLSATGTATATPGQAYTLNLSATDADGVTITSWTINWGDGQIQTVVGNPPSVTHTYGAALTGLSFNVAVAATDVDGTWFGNRLYVPTWAGTDAVHIYQGQAGTFVGTMAPLTDGLDDHIEVIQGPNGHLYVSSEQSDSVLEYTTAGALVRTFVPPGSGGLNASAGMGFGPDGHLYVASYQSNQVLRYDGSTGAFLGVAVAAGDGGFGIPLGLNFGPDGMMYVASRANGSIMRFDAPTGTRDAGFAATWTGPDLEDFTFGPDGHIYAADGDRIVRLNGSTGAFIDAFVAAGAGGLSYAVGLAFGPDGRLYVSDQNADAIRVYHGTTGASLGDHVPAGGGGLNSPTYITFAASHQVTVAATANDQPAFGNLDGTPAHTEGGSPVVLDGNVQVTDAELSAADNFSGATLTLVRNGGASAQDIFSATGTLSALTEGGNLVLAGTTIGTVTTNSGGTLVLSFNANATNVRVNQAMQQIAYATTSDAPPASVQVNWTFDDGNSGAQGSGGALQATGITTVSITAVNDPPVIAALDGDTRAYIEGDAPALLGSANTLTDVDSADFAGGALTIAFTGGSDSAEDVLAVRHEGNGAGQIGVSGGTVSFGGVNIGSWTGGSSGAALVITLGASADAVATLALINNITYYNTDAVAPTTGNRAVRVVLTDGDDGTSLPSDTVMSVSALNDPPAITSNGGGATAGINVAENSTAVTTVTRSDVDGGVPVYSIIGGADAAKFAIDVNTGALSFLTAPDFEAPTDAGANQVYDVTVQVSDGAGGTDAQAIAVTVSNVNEAPAGTNKTVTTIEGGAYTFTTADFGFVDASDSPANGLLAVTVATVPGAGSLTLSGVPVTAGQSVSAANIASNLLVFTPAANANGAGYASFTFQVQDNGGTANGGVDLDPTPNTMTVDVTAVNDAPLASGSATLAPIAKNASNPPGASVSTLFSGNFSDSTDEVTGGSSANSFAGIAIGSYTVDAAKGSWQYSTNGGSSWTALSSAGTTTAITLNATDLMRFVPANNYTGAATALAANLIESPQAITSGATLNLSGATGGTTRISTATVALVQTIFDANAAPTLDNTRSPALSAQNEDAGAPVGAVGTPVSALVDFASPAGQLDNVSDPDAGALLGIAVTGADTSQGSWWYSINGGANWNALGAVSDANARLLAADANTRLYFQANANYNGSLANAITLRAWDRTSGTNGGSANLSGGSSTVRDQFDAVSYSNNQGTANWNGAWTEVGDNPNGSPSSGKTAISGGALSIAAWQQDSQVWRSANLSGATSATLTFARNNQMSGNNQIAVEVSGDGGTNWSTLFTYTRSANAGVGTDSFDISAFASADTRIRWRVASNNGSMDAVTVDNVQIAYSVSMTGGTTAFSIATDSASLTVNPVADTPSVTNASTNEDTQTSSGLVISRHVADGAEVTHFKITGISNGTLFKNDGTTPIASGTFITVAEGNAGLKFTPAAQFNGSGSFTVQASTSNLDAGLGGGTATATITVNAVNDAPVITSNGGGASAALNVAENATAVTTVTASDVDAGATQTYSIGGGADAALFTINGSTGALSFNAAPNFEVPQDAGANNIYDVTVQVSDGAGGIDTQAIAVTVTAVNDNNPVITSNGGGATAAVNMAENNTAATTVTASDADLPAQTLTYSISGGVDAARFTIDSNTGALSFVSAPDFEVPTDAGGNNVYDLSVQVTDGAMTDSQTIAVTVTAANDNAPIITSNGAGASASIDVAENTTAVATVTATDADLPAQTVVYSIVGGADAARFSIVGATGVLRFVAAPDYESPTDGGANNVYDVRVQASDGAGFVDTQDIAVSVTNGNEAPTATITPASYSVNEQAVLVLGGTGLGVADPDAGAAAVSATLSVGQGALSATAGTTGVVISGSGTASLVLLGTVAQLNALFAGAGGSSLSYQDGSDTPAASTTLTLLVDDLGNSGAGGALTASDSAVVSITAVNDTPVIAAPARASVIPGQTLVFDPAQYLGISLADADVAGSMLELQLTVSGGELSLATTTGLSFSVGDGTADAAITVTGTLVDLNAALNGMSYTPAVGFNGNDSLALTVSDLGSTGAGGTLNAGAAVDIYVGNNTFLRGFFVEAGVDQYGTLGSDGPAPIGYHSAGEMLGAESDPQRDGWATYDGDFITPGSPLDEWGVRIDGTTYRNDSSAGSAGIAGSAAATVDNGMTQTVLWTGATAGLNVSQSFVIGRNDLHMDIAVTLTNTTGAPMLDLYYYRHVDPDNNYDQNGSFETTNTIVSQGDVTGVSYASASQPDGSFMGLVGFGAESRVAHGNFGGIEPSDAWDGLNGHSTSGSALEDLGITLVYRIASLAAGASVTLDARYLFGSESAPYLDLDPDDSTGAGTDHASSFTEGSGGVAIADTDAAVSDADSPRLSGMTLTISNPLDGAAEVLSANTAGTSIVASYAGGVLTLTGSDTAAHYNQVLRSVIYNNSADNPDTTARAITVSVSDGVNTSNVATATVSILAVNDAPTIGLPAAQSVAEDATLVLSTGNGNAIGIGDLDDNGGTLRLTLTASTGTLTLGSTAGLIFVSGDGLADASMSVEGTKAALNAALQGLAFSPAANFNGAASITVVVNDLGNTGSGGAGNASQSLAVSVTAVNDEQVLASNLGLTVVENTTGNAITNAVLNTTDVDNSTAQLVYTLTALPAQGTLKRSGTALGLGQTFTQADIDGGLVRYDHSGSESSADSFGFTVDDGAGAGSAGSFALTITPVNDQAPVIGSNGGGASAAVNVAENTTAVTTVVASDGDLPAQTITYSIAGGADAARFAINTSTGALTFVAAPDHEVPQDVGADNVYVVVVQASDGSLTDSQTVNVTVTPVNDNDPVIGSNGGGASASVGIFENTTAVTTVTVTDADLPAQTLTFSISGGADAARFAIDSVTGALRFVVAPDREAPDDVGADNVYDLTVSVSDGAGRTDSQNLAVTVLDVDEAPVITRLALVLSEGATLVLGSAQFDVSDVDTGNASLAWNVSSVMQGRFEYVANPGVAITAFTQAQVLAGQVQFVHDGGELAPSFLASVGDAVSRTADQAGAIGFTNVNDAPVLGAPLPDRGATQDAAFNFTFAAGTFTDADTGDSLGYSAGAMPAWLAFNPGTRTFSGTPGNAHVGTVSITVRATDLVGSWVEDTFDLTVANVNDPPVGSPVITGTAAEDQTLSADLSGVSDADGLGAFSYQWTRNGVDIAGATASTYLLVDADVQTQIRVRVSYVDGLGTTETLTSAPTAPVVNVNDAPTGTPVVQGTAEEDQTLTADTSGIGDLDGIASFSYQWTRNGVDIAGATGSTYLLGDADVQTQIRVRVSYVDGWSTTETLTSAPTAAVANVNDVPTGTPVITGMPQEDQTLSADTSGIGDIDGLGAFSYQWTRSGVDIAGATASTYLLVDADVQTQIRVRVSYVDGRGTTETLTSAPTAPVVNVNDVPTGAPVILGTVQEDQTLTADTSGIADIDGVGAYSYQWTRNGVDIAGATAATYVLGDADVQTLIRVRVSYIDGWGTTEALTSAPTAAVVNVNDTPTGAPVIAGTVQEDQTLTADTSGIGDIDGLGAFSYQWTRNGVDIAGATASTHLLGDADVQTQIRVRVRYVDGWGTTETLTSAPTAPVANVNDVPTGGPVILGTAEEDRTLTADTSGIGDIDGLGAYSYQWTRNGVDIAGATASSHLLGDADVQTQICVRVSYVDGWGTTETLTSAPTVPVVNVNDVPTGTPVILGTAEEDQTLTADTNGIGDLDGVGAYSYQWTRNGVDIAGATAATYLVGNADVQTLIGVRVSYVDGWGTTEALTSADVGPVANVNDPPTGAPVIVGTVQEDQTLTADTSGIGDIDGLGAYSYQWTRNGADIAGETASSYLLGDADVQSQIRVRVRYVDGWGTTETSTSAPTAPVANVNDTPTGQAVITGTAEEDQTLTADTSDIGDIDGVGALSYQWTRNGVDIAGATAST